MKYLFMNRYKPISNLKTARLKNILYWATEVKHLGMIPAMKFLMDENCQCDSLGKTRMINVKQFFAEFGMIDHGNPDDFILEMATRQGYTVVTRDKKFVIMAYDEGIPIIYNPDNERYFLVERRSLK